MASNNRREGIKRLSIIIVFFILIIMILIYFSLLESLPNVNSNQDFYPFEHLRIVNSNKMSVYQLFSLSILSLPLILVGAYGISKFKASSNRDES